VNQKRTCSIPSSFIRFSTARRDATLDVARSFDVTIVERVLAVLALGRAIGLLPPRETTRASGAVDPRPRLRCPERHFIDLTAKHQDFLARYRAQDWDAADALSTDCEDLGGAHLHGLYALYRERIAALRVTPPPDNWDGTAEALSK
jgi:hypothetical protein